MNPTSKLTEAQKQVQKYLEKHKIEEILSDLLNTLAHTKDEKPIPYMIKFLANLCHPEDLKDAGFVIPGPYPIINLAITYPKFENKRNNLFKTHLTPEVFLSIKNNRTMKYVSLRELINIGLENEDDKIGILAPDEDTYSTFAPLFNPILQEINNPILINETNYSNQINMKELKNDNNFLLSDENKFIDSIKIKLTRNLKGYVFNSLILGHEREEIQQKIQIALIRLKEYKFEEYHDLGNIILLRKMTQNSEVKSRNKVSID